MSGAGELKHGHFFEVVAAAAVLVAALILARTMSRAGHVGWGGAVPREA